MKIDAHQHFWIYNPSEYGWIDDRMKILRRDHLPADLLPELEQAGFSGTIAVQARQSIEETRWLLELAAVNDFIKGVVGWADLCDQERLKKQLDEFCAKRKFAGVRHVVQDEPDDNFMLRDDFLKGISFLKEYNLTYDLLLFPKHLPVAEKLVSMFPEQKFVLDHIAKPPIRDQILSPWKDDIMKLAKHGNVWCKLSGMVTEAGWNNSDPEIFNPYLDIVFEAFGPERLMTGSDWPVCRVASGYSHVMEIVENYISDLSPHEQAGIAGLNCISFYGISGICS